MHSGFFSTNLNTKKSLYAMPIWLLYILTALGLSLSMMGCTSQTPNANSSPNHLPPHHTENGFQNPYVTGDINPGPLAFLKARYFGKQEWPDEPLNHQNHWQPANENLIHSKTDFAKVTLLGHSSVLLQHKNINILTDPMFSERAFPVQFAGPKRFTDLALPVEKLPPIDIVVISHNHYDHLDTNTVKTLGNKPLWLVPLGLKDWFAEAGVSNVIEMDWWDTYKTDDLIITAMPSQHWSRRGLFDMNKSLWASWGFEWPDFSTWFGGDTGYNTIQFKEIGKHFGSLDLAMIPIGAYEPRWFMKNQHANPSDAVKIFKDLKAKEAFGIHWNTFVLTAEPVDEPPKALLKAMKENNLEPDRFTAMAIGKTWLNDN